MQHNQRNLHYTKTLPLIKNTLFLKDFGPKYSSFKHLPHKASFSVETMSKLCINYFEITKPFFKKGSGRVIAPIFFFCNGGTLYKLLSQLQNLAIPHHHDSGDCWNNSVYE